MCTDHGRQIRTPHSTLGDLKRPAGPALPAKSLSSEHEDLSSSPVTLIKEGKECGSLVVTEEPGCKVEMCAAQVAGNSSNDNSAEQNGSV